MASGGVAAGRACSETERPRNPAPKFPARAPDIWIYARFRDKAVGKLQEVVRTPHSPGRVVALASPIGRAPICSAKPAAVARGLRDTRRLANWSRRTGLGRSGSRVALIYWRFYLLYCCASSVRGSVEFGRPNRAASTARADSFRPPQRRSFAGK